MDIRQCQEEDLHLLETGNPSPGQTRYHDRRFERQQQGDSTFLIAWADGVPIGTGEILWRGCAAPQVHQRYRDCPELNGLRVWPAERRSHGIGTAIIHAAEALTRDLGCHQIGLGVDDDNPRTAGLYRRLGYQETGLRYLDRYYYLDDHGHRHDIADPARFMVKQLREQQPDTSHPEPEHRNPATHSDSGDI
jgi:RimJ/RimL family protein N-acetyltransferase